jgi:hypothetical protein
MLTLITIDFPDLKANRLAASLDARADASVPSNVVVATPPPPKLLRAFTPNAHSEKRPSQPPMYANNWSCK